MAITKSTGRGKVGTKGLIYGTKGIGKSTLLAKLPKARMVDPNFGTAKLDIEDRWEVETFKDLSEVLEHALDDDINHLVIDEFCELEQRLYREVAADNGVEAIGNISYGGGYREATNRLRNLIGYFDELVESGKNVFLIGHSKTVKFKNPEGEDWDMYRLDMRDSMRDILERAFDLELFCKLDIAVSTEEKGFEKKTLAKSGDRVMCAESSAAFDAKNRLDMRPIEVMDSGMLLGYLEASKMGRAELVEQVSGNKNYKDDMTDAKLRQLYAFLKKGTL